ncbi:hypothetical protein OK016_04790 [Vibrio chagasii]|nr:hypothetical protein [Vibrio chagasii]
MWLLFLFDKNLEAGWKPTVRPPRLGGSRTYWSFASLVPTFRPNWHVSGEWGRHLSR